MNEPASSTDAMSLLGPGDPPPFRWHRAQGRRPWLIVCDHAGRAFPAALGSLGLPPEATVRHIAWDIGAADLACALADRLDAPALLANYSRLVVDCNRRLEDPTAFTLNGDGHRVPGNEGLTPLDRSRRTAACYTPYHDAIAGHLGALRGRGGAPLLLAVHSFTPVYRATARPWHVGVLWDTDDRIATPLLARLRREAGLVVGDNEPYSGRYPADYTVWQHAGRDGHPVICLEIRQDLLLTRQGVAEWADRLAAALLAVVGATTLGCADV